MKKIVNLFFVIVLVTLLAACSKPESSVENNESNDQNSAENQAESSSEEMALEPEEGAELLIWGSGDENQEWMEYVMEKFTEEYGIPTSFEDVGHTDAPEKLQTDGPAGLGGDVFMGAHDHVGAMNQAGLIYENYFEEEYKDRMMEGAIGAVSSLDENGELQMYGFPLAVETVAMAYNKDLLDEMGFEPAETMDELIEQSKEFMEENPDKYGFMLEPGNFYGNFGFIGASGAYIFGDDNTNPDDIGLNNEGAVQAAELFKKIRDEILPLTPEDLTGDVINSYFDEGNLLYTIDGSWAVEGRLDAGVNLGIIPLPKVANGEVPTPFLGVKALFINAYSEYPKAATLFAQFASSDEMLLERFKYTGELPASENLLNNEEITSNEIIYPFLEQARHAVAMPNITEMQSVWGPMEVAFSVIWKEDVDPQEALDRGVEQIQDAFDSQIE